MANYILSEAVKNSVNVLLKRQPGSTLRPPTQVEYQSAETFPMGPMFDCGISSGGVKDATHYKITIADGCCVFVDPENNIRFIYGIDKTELEIPFTGLTTYHQVYLAFDGILETDTIHVVQAASLNDFSYVDTSKKYFMLMYSIEMEGAVLTRHLPRFRWASKNSALAAEEEPPEEPSGERPPPCGHPGNEPGAGGDSTSGDDTDHPGDGDDDVGDGNVPDHPGDGEGESGVTPECGDPI